MLLRHYLDEGLTVTEISRELVINIVGGPDHSTLSNGAFPTREFGFMLINPPNGKSWKTDLEPMGAKNDRRDLCRLQRH